VKPRLIPFGIALQTFQIEEPRSSAPVGRPLKILSIGNDRTRDWKTLFAALGNDPRFEVRVICRWLPKDFDGRCGNVTIERQMAPFGFSQVYREADLTVVTLSENVFSGITVILESVAAGTPVVSSRTGGGPTYFGEDEVTFVPTGDPEALKRAILETSPDEFAERARRAQARFKMEDYSTAGMVGRYAAKTEAILRLQRREAAPAPGRVLLAE
jgi:glycosyltransferase involved in cell wall biosynthesis